MIHPSELKVGNLLIFGTNPDPSENLVLCVETIGKDGINHVTEYSHPDDGYLPSTSKYEFDALSGLPISKGMLVNVFGWEPVGKYDHKKNFNGIEFHLMDIPGMGYELSIDADGAFPSIRTVSAISGCEMLVQAKEAMQ